MYKRYHEGTLSKNHGSFKTLLMSGLLQAVCKLGTMNISGEVFIPGDLTLASSLLCFHHSLPAHKSMDFSCHIEHSFQISQRVVTLFNNKINQRLVLLVRNNALLKKHPPLTHFFHSFFSCKICMDFLLSFAFLLQFWWDLPPRVI